MPRIAIYHAEETPSLAPADRSRPPQPGGNHAALAKLAQLLQLPLCASTQDWDYWLFFYEGRLSLQKQGEKSLPLCVDFSSEQITYRRKQTSLKKESLARALGLKGNTATHIIDATAGLGRDSFILASLGFEITLLERSPIMAALLADGLQRALQDPEVAPIAQRMRLIPLSGIEFLPEINPKERPSHIYVDPMFPERSKSALVKKEMRLLHDLIGQDPDADALLEAALACATERVVVKRPRLAEPLGTMKPSFQMQGSSSRFDVYLTLGRTV